jgi:hypothetical protein
VAAELDIDLDGEIEPLTDGILALRYMFGFRDETLIASAVDLLCDRCEADEIEDYIASILPLLDIDDNNDVDALTDGVLIVRYLFGFRDASLVIGAVALDCGSRCSADDIETYIQTLID